MGSHFDGIAMTRGELLAHGPAIELAVANRALRLGRTKGYELARSGQYPCAVLRPGNRYRVITSDLIRVLRLAEADENHAQVPEADVIKSAA